MRAFILALLACPATASAQTSQPQAPVPACNASEYRQFDFWVGEWDVYPAKSDKPVARSVIERLYDGCAIRENWMPLARSGGGSLNSFRPSDGKWHQLWVDSQGSWLEFVGQAASGGMILQSSAAETNQPITRMTFSPFPDGTVRQLGETSADGGKSWTTSFDFTYRPRAPKS